MTVTEFIPLLATFSGTGIEATGPSKEKMLSAVPETALIVSCMLDENP
jgi:hypothetical protein